MNIFVKLFWVFSLCVFGSGCASNSYRHAVLPGSIAPGSETELLKIVRVGANVRVVFHSQRVISGIVFAVSENQLILSPSHEFSDGNISISVEEIKYVEMQYGKKSEVILVSALVTAVAVGLYVVFSRIGRAMGN